MKCQNSLANYTVYTKCLTPPGLPIVTTTVGNEGSGFQDSVHVCIADSPANFASALRRLLGEPLLRASLAHASQTFLRDNYDQKSRLIQLLQPTAARASRTRALQTLTGNFSEL